MAGNKRWSQKEIDVLYKHYQGTDIDTVIKMLNKERSKDAIHKKASDLGISFAFEERSEIMSQLKIISNRLYKIELFFRKQKCKKQRLVGKGYRLLRKELEKDV